MFQGFLVILLACFGSCSIFQGFYDFHGSPWLYNGFASMFLFSKTPTIVPRPVPTVFHWCYMVSSCVRPVLWFDPRLILSISLIFIRAFAACFFCFFLNHGFACDPPLFCWNLRQLSMTWTRIVNFAWRDKHLVWSTTLNTVNTYFHGQTQW